MASLRRAACAVAALKPGPAHQLTTVRWLGGPSGGGGGIPGGPRRGGHGARYGRRRRRGPPRFLGLLTVALVGGGGMYLYSTQFPGASSSDKKERPPPNVVIPKADIVFEETAVAGEVRAALGAQNQQVQKSIEHPGVYAWGSNAGRVVAPDSGEAVVKEPRRIRFLDGQILRDLRLDRDVGVAVTEQGDVLQWGVGFWGKQAVEAGEVPHKKTKTNATPSSPLAPVATLTGKNIVKVALSNDRVIALAASGAVYSLPVSRADLQPLGPSGSATAASTTPASATSWWRRALWSNPSASAAPAPSAGIRTITPAGLAWGERVVDVRGGLEHCLLLTSKGRVFSAVSSLSSFPAKGQLGIQGLTWDTRPRDRPLDAPVEVPGLRGIAAAQIAAGDYHSLVLARDGALYSFGDNSTGQLCIPASPSFPGVDVPVRVPVDKLYEPTSGDGAPPRNIVLAGDADKGRRPVVRVTSIAAGGATSFFTVDVESPASTGSDGSRGTNSAVTTADTWSCGSGIYGSLGTGKWVHISTAGPGKVRALSGLAEYSEAARRTVPIRLVHLDVGTTHACAVLSNATHVVAPSPKAHGANWGADTLWWGGNEFYQLGTGRRSNQSEPVHIQPLDAPPEARARAAAAAAAPAAAGTENESSRELSRERLALTPRTTVRLGGAGGRKVSVQQRVTCGRYVSAVYSGA